MVVWYIIYNIEHKWNCWSGLVTPRVLLSSFLHHWVVVLAQQKKTVRKEDGSKVNKKVAPFKIDTLSLCNEFHGQWPCY